jgi:hypothetical protein
MFDKKCGGKYEYYTCDDIDSLQIISEIGEIYSLKGF